MFKTTTFAVLALTIAATSMVSNTASARGGGSTKDSTKIEQLLDGKDSGGPWVEGGVSPYQSRHKVCQYLETPAYDYSGGRTVVRKKTCWFE